MKLASGNPGAVHIQYLEGPNDALESVLRKIKMDHRHTNLVVLEEGSIAERKFPDWDMGMSEATTFSLKAELPQHSREPSPKFLLDFLMRAAQVQRQKSQ